MNEKDLFFALKQHYLPDLMQSKNQFATYDCFSKEFNTFIELKCRNSHYENLMIEQSKYDRLKYEALERGMTPMYICSTPQGVWAFNLNITKIDWELKKDLPTTTEFDDKRKITKSVGFLPIQQGNKLSKFKGEK